MEELGSIINNIARLAVYLFGGMSVLAVCYAGFLYMTAAGDPQKSSQARNALFAAFGGMIIVGLAFLAPRIISTAVLEPAGGESVAGTSGTDCDSVLRNQLVRQQAAGSSDRMNQVIVQVQQRQSEDCSEEVWDPEIKKDGDVANYGGSATTRCASSVAYASDRTIGGLQVPSGLARFTNDISGSKTVNSGRDGQNNIIVYFGIEGDERPGDGALCWMYVERLQTWVVGS